MGMYSDIGKELRDLGFTIQSNVWNLKVGMLIQDAEKRAAEKGFKDKYLKSSLEAPKFKMSRTGEFMEDTLNELNAINNEMETSKKILENLFNEIKEVGSWVNETLLIQLKELRTNRMTVVLELRNLLTMLQDIRKFFLESDYRTEIERLKEFIDLCGKMKCLKNEGTLDAICDAAIRLAIKEGDEK